jgi:TetR/AcrR family transcriptional regulator
MKTSSEVIKARRDREKKYRVESIVNSAHKVFSEKGFLKSTMDEIALGAEVSKPTIYQYFKTKEDLFISFAIPIIDSIHQVLKKLIEQIDNDRILTFSHLIQELFGGYFKVYEKSPEMFKVLQIFQETKLLLELDPQIRKKILRKAKTNYLLMRQVLEKAMSKGIMEKYDPFPLADIIWGATVGIIQVEDIKNDYKKGHKFKKIAFKMVADIFATALDKRLNNLENRVINR